MARIGTAWLEIDGDLSPLNRKLAELRAKEGTIEVKVDIDRGSFARAARASGALGGEKEVDLRANIDMSSFARARAVQAVLTKESNKLGDVFNRSQLSIGQWTGILAASSPVILDVAGALGALTASLGAATLGLGAMAAGAAAAATVGLGGVAAIAIPAISSLTDLMTAQEAATKAQVTGAGSAARAAASSAQQISAAHDQVISAEQQLESAQESAEIAQDSLTAAREEATRQLQDMRRAALGADASEESARIALARSQSNLNQILRDATSSSLDIREAENEVVLARQNLTDVTIAGNRAQKDFNEAQRGGINQMPGVVSAQQSLDSAMQGVADASKGVADALKNVAYQQQQANMAAGAGGTTLAALALAQKKAGPAAVAFAKHLKELGRSWRGLTKEGRNDFFGMLDDGVSRLNQKLPLLAESANESMKALRGGFSAFLDKATGPEFDHFIKVMTNTFAKSIGPVSRGLGNIAKVLQRIAVAVAPDIVRMAHGFEDMTKNWVQSTANADKLRDTVHGLVGHTKAWWNLLVAAKDLIIAALVPGMGEGKKAIEDMTGQLKEWTNWINAHPKETREFFKEALETTKQLAKTLISFLPTLFQISVAMRPLARVVLGILKGLNSLKIGNVSALTGLLAVFLGAKLIRGIQGITAAFVAMRTAALGAGAASAAAGAASAVPLGVGTSATTATGRVIGSTGGKAAGGRFATAFGSAARAGLIGAAAVGIYEAFTTEGGIIDTIRGKGSVSGEAMAEGLSSSFAKSAQPKLNTAFKSLNFRALDAISVAVHNLIDDFERAGIEIPDNLRKFASSTDNQIAKVKEALGDWRSSMTELKHMIFRNLGDIKDKTRESIRDINQIEGIGQNRRLDLTQKTYHAELQTIRKSLRLGLISHKEANREIERITRKILKAYGVKDVQRLIVSDRVLAGAANRAGQQTGGMIVPGQGTGDKIPGRLPVGSGIINRKAADVLLEPRELALPPEIVKRIGGPKVIERINRAIPRFATGGVVDRTGVQHFAKGGMAAMVAEANRFERRHFPYVWGGGHGSFGIQPVDCSGAVSDVLHAARLLDAPMVSGALANWGKPGKGPLTVYANPVHTLMSLNGRFFGTSSSNPGGGAGWIEGGFDQGYLSGFAARTMEAGGMGKIRLPRYKATAKTAVDEAASLNKIAKAGELAIKSAIAAGGRFGGGQSLVDFSKGPGKIVGASVYGFGEPGTGTVGASGESLPGKPAFAELDMGTALGHLPFGKKLGIEVGGRRAVGVKLDIGAGGGSVEGQPRAIDFWRDLAQQLGLSGSFLGLAKVKGLQEGGMVPYVGSFDRGGTVARTGLGLVHEGERVIPALQTGGVIEMQGGGFIPMLELRGLMDKLPRDIKRFVKTLKEVSLNLSTQLSEGKRARLKHIEKIDPEDRTKKQQKELVRLRKLSETHQKLTKEERRDRIKLRQGVRSYPGDLKKMKTAFGADGVFSGVEKKRLKEFRTEHHLNVTRLHDLNEQRRLHRREERRERRLEGRIERGQARIEGAKELAEQLKELRTDLKEHNRLVKNVRVNEKAALRVLSNIVGGQIGAQGHEKTRLAAAGSVVRY